LGSTSSVSQVGIELILMRQLADYLAMPVFIVDKDGALVFYNEAAHLLLGHPYEENGELPLEEWSAGFRPQRENGEAVPPEELPLVTALKQGVPAQLSPLLIEGSDGKQRQIGVSAFPLVGQQGPAGAVAIFWEVTADADNAVGH
jgi:PAS domain-containing protein